MPLVIWNPNCRPFPLWVPGWESGQVFRVEPKLGDFTPFHAISRFGDFGKFVLSRIKSLLVDIAGVLLQGFWRSSDDLRDLWAGKQTDSWFSIFQFSNLEKIQFFLPLSNGSTSSFLSWFGSLQGWVPPWKRRRLNGKTSLCGVESSDVAWCGCSCIWFWHLGVCFLNWCPKTQLFPTILHKCWTLQKDLGTPQILRHSHFSFLYNCSALHFFV